MQPPALQFQHVTKRYGATQVLGDLDLEISNGEFFGLVGMNGAGKTTLIKCLLDFCALDGGSIEIFGVSHRQTEARNTLAFLPERFMPPYYLTGQDFLKYMLKLQSRLYDPLDAATILSALDLDISALNRPVRAYSKGMTQKLGLAACFLASKELYVLDEPMSGLDPKARALLKAHLQEMRTAGRTLFFSSHALADVEEICDRMAILHDGEIRFIGPPAACCRLYGTSTLEQAYLKCIG
ncbi:multidrug ABC transporter ATPase [Sulfuricella sp. T08]|uniref:ABC transporter ATP-binding protein n=1 Tax=Sulfuricella sp. T08 TaxID=1632857 RepID=UPI00061798B0|nr:ABC transporter ATP-binding protein [Sulfuricella sp. T08]GAO35884.1 multidrug ABC transporter ATPase [Sulfuricella sp. T08]